MEPDEKRRADKANFQRVFGRYWLIYVSLIGTAVLTISSGVMLAMQPDDGGQIVITPGVILAALFYASGFFTTGEGAFYFWFDKLTDHDEDNGWQIGIAVAMLIASVVTILVTSLAAGAFIAFWLGKLTAFDVMPIWAQNWVVWVIPVMWVAHAVSGVAFRAMSDEAASEREAKSIVRKTRNKILRQKQQAKADYWQANAPAQAVRMGEIEAQREIETMFTDGRPNPPTPRQ